MHNRTLTEENKRLSDLARLLLSSPQFTPILDQLSSQSLAVPAHSQAQTQDQGSKRGDDAQTLAQPLTQAQQLQSDSKRSIGSCESDNSAAPTLPSQTSPASATSTA